MALTILSSLWLKACKDIPQYLLAAYLFLPSVKQNSIQQYKNTLGNHPKHNYWLAVWVMVPF